mgnify:FL=1
MARAAGQEATSHGYDIVTNKGYFDKDPAALAPARTVPKPSHWERLQTSSNHFWNTRTMQTQQRLALSGRPASEGAAIGGGGGGIGGVNALDSTGSARGRPPAVPALDMSRARAPIKQLEMTAGSSVRTGGFK